MRVELAYLQPDVSLLFPQVIKDGTLGLKV
jgi:hypothetical protein